MHKPRNTEESKRLLSVIIGFSFAASIYLYCLVLYLFKSNPTALLYFLLIFTSVVLFPTALLSMLSATVVVGNLRDTLAGTRS